MPPIRSFSPIRTRFAKKDPAVRWRKALGGSTREIPCSCRAVQMSAAGSALNRGVVL
ncbi:uncharacterized protein TRAVEDRAFT_30575, partial [Trametes versicolor FP-101664 SS1]|uniref:uncharacterized protein n=1 Tax=Trametes versicolor (strain FP-101664) TaxID=717944 RepID=UPI00046238D4